ncbi:MAG: glycosyltransferase family 2 protein, partial [Candidatus Blackburnbacteria bacterium]|nr:glycosyltransferase family 2 protein [Candidatus Blackburnbacteria bacterium]
MKRTITAHCLVKNEARFIWYSVMSVVNHVDKVLLWDTGSSDGTLEIIRKMRMLGDTRLPDGQGKSKIEFREVGSVSPEEFASVRQEMLDATDTDWFIVVDGDEIWWEDSIALVTAEIQKHGDGIESIVIPTVNLVGDIFHYQEREAGGYVLAGRKGHLALRGVNTRIPGLRSERPHGTWGWVDGNGKMIQDRDPRKITFLDAPYIHATHLQR